MGLGRAGFAADQHGELVTAHARQHGGFRQLAFQGRGDDHDQLVAGGVAIDVVDVLEAVEIDEDDGIADVAARLGDLLQPFEQGAAVGQAAQPVGQGKAAGVLFA